MKNKTYSFTFSLSFIFTFLLTLSFSIIIMYNYYKTSSDIYSLSDTVNDEIRKSVIDKTVAKLDKIATHMKVLSKINPNSDILQNKESTLKIMWEQLFSDETIASIFIADGKSNFIQARRKPIYSTRIVEKYGDTRMEIWENKDKNYITTAIETYESTYDPVTRDWYKLANKRGEFYWSKPYIFSSTGKTGITISFPEITEYGNKIKVTAADITLDDLSKLLKEQSKIVKGDLILFGEDQEIIASSFYENIKEKNDGKIINLKELPDNYFGGFVQTLLLNKYSGEFIDKSGIEYIYAIDNFPDMFNEKWKLATFVKKDLLLASIRNTINKMLLMSIVIMITFLFLILYISKIISRPIIKISEYMDELKDMNLDIDIQVNSNINEIRTVQNSMISLRSGLASFKKYMPSELVKILIQTNQEIKIGGSEKNLAIMFTDIENFTTISETMSPEALMVHLSNYFEELVPIITRNHGTVDKYIGDAILSFWGAPLNIDDPCLSAVQTAIEIQNKLKVLNAKWQSEGKAQFITRIGIHFGATLVGNIGSHDRLNYTIIGDSVNIASRLEGINKQFGTEIMISEEVNEKINSKINTKYIDSVLLKGKTESRKLYTIVN
ncbi:MAG: adenylate/guanylate cyclase domain-containing protein [Arcobacteraceae bacterium]|nr:adenylate/guanylate cyclase domain-containing protein [Arcobacteraceae bacterium]